MTDTTRTDAWRAYLSACTLGATPEQRRFAFQQWWRLERADSVATCAQEEKAEKGKQRQATSAPGRRR